MPTLLLYSHDDPVEMWRDALVKVLPADVTVRIYPDTGPLEEIDYTLAWWPKPGLLASLPNLKLILSFAAGIDHILADPERPAHLPIVRMVDTYLRDMMSEYAVLGVLHFHRYLPEYAIDQRQQSWNRRWCRYTPENKVGVLGLGNIGQDVAKKLGVFGFQMHGWSRTEKSIPGLTCHHGDDGLNDILAISDYLVCVLPLTAATEGILNRNTLSRLPQGAFVVNIARGGHVVDEALLELLDSGHLGGAFLDVFNQEPLPAGHPYWNHPKVWITPHIAGEIEPKSAASAVAANIQRHRNGETIPDIVDLARGY